MRRERFHGEVGRRELDAIVGRQRHLASADFKPGDAFAAKAQKCKADTGADQLTRADAAAHIREFQCRQIGAQAHRSVGQTHVGGEARQTRAFKADPGAQAAAAGFHIGGIIYPGSPGGQIDACEVRVKLAAPRAEIIERVAAQICTQIKHAAQRFRRLAHQRDTVARTKIDCDQLNIGQRQFRCAAPVVVPAQARFADYDAPLAEDPVGYPA